MKTPRNIHIHIHVLSVIMGVLLAGVWRAISGDGPSVGAVLFGSAVAILGLAIAIFRSAANEHSKIVEAQISQGLSPCHYRPVEGVPCGRHQGHAGPHLVRPTDMIKAGYHPTPF